MKQPPRTWEEPNRLYAKGNGDQLVVAMSIAVKETDPIWQSIADHVRRHRLTLIHERRCVAPSASVGEVIARWYGRAELFTYVAFHGRTAHADARIDAMLDGLR